VLNFTYVTVLHGKCTTLKLKKIMTINPQNTGGRIMNITMRIEPYMFSKSTVDTSH